jgi:hypothetical protein
MRVDIIVDSLFPPPLLSWVDGKPPGPIGRAGVVHCQAHALARYDPATGGATQWFAWVPLEGELGRAWPEWLLVEVFKRAAAAGPEFHQVTNTVPWDIALWAWKLGAFSSDPRERQRGLVRLARDEQFREWGMWA